MNTDSKFKLALRELMRNTPLDEISVTLLCKRCGCHRQTFYYHYSDIHDLMAEIFLSEKIALFEESTTIKDALYAFKDYGKKNLTFYKKTYDSSARDLPDDFIFGKMGPKFYELIRKDKKKWGIDNLQSCRLAARRYAKMVADGFSSCFKESKISSEKFDKKMTIFIDKSMEILLPAIIEMVKEEAKAEQ